MEKRNVYDEESLKFERFNASEVPTVEQGWTHSVANKGKVLIVGRLTLNGRYRRESFWKRLKRLCPLKC